MDELGAVREESPLSVPGNSPEVSNLLVLLFLVLPFGCFYYKCPKYCSGFATFSSSFLAPTHSIHVLISAGTFFRLSGTFLVSWNGHFILCPLLFWYPEPSSCNTELFIFPLVLFLHFFSLCLECCSCFLDRVVITMLNHHHHQGIFFRNQCRLVWI